MTKPVKNPDLVIKPEGEANCLVFDKKTEQLFRLSTFAVGILELCDGKLSVEEIFEKVVSEEELTLEDLRAFLDQFAERNLVSYQ